MKSDKNPRISFSSLQVTEEATEAASYSILSLIFYLPSVFVIEFAPVHFSYMLEFIQYQVFFLSFYCSPSQTELVRNGDNYFTEATEYRLNMKT